MGQPRLLLPLEEMLGEESLVAPPAPGEKRRAPLHETNGFDTSLGAPKVSINTLRLLEEGMEEEQAPAKAPRPSSPLATELTMLEHEITGPRGADWYPPEPEMEPEFLRQREPIYRSISQSSMIEEQENSWNLLALELLPQTQQGQAPRARPKRKGHLVHDESIAIYDVCYLLI